jgi:site-specific recombinase XerD
MPGRTKSPVPKPLDPGAVITAYQGWLDHQPLAARSRDAYLDQVTSFVTWLSGSDHGAMALSEHAARDRAVRDYKRHVKTERKWAPSSVNQALAAIDNFYRSLSVGRAEISREELPQVAPRALEEADQRSFLRAVERCPSARDRAIATVFLNTALRLAELAALGVGDISVSARRGKLTVRSGKGESYREIPLNSTCRDALTQWMIARSDQLSRRAGDEDALWLSRTGTRLTPRAIDLVLRRLADDAGVDLSAHLLRHTCLTNLVRAGTDLVLVAEIAGHRRLDTTRRYSLPSQADREAALEALVRT